MSEFKFTPNQHYIDSGRRMFEGIAGHALITIEGVKYEYPIAYTVNRDGFYKHYFDVEDDPVGDIEKIELFDKGGASLGTGEGLIEKGNNGWSISVKLFVLLKEEVDADADAG